MERAIKGLVTGRYEWIVFTSTNAVRAVREKFEEFGLDARAFAGVKIACVGEATADAVRAFGIPPELVPSGEQSSEGLLADFPPYDDVLDPIDRVLLPRADIATETLAAGLRERGWEIDDVTAYRTVRAAPPAAEIRDAIKSGGFQAVCFTSSSTVRNLVGIAGKPHARTVVACIGPQTAATAREFGLRVDVEPEHATVPALVDALAEFAAARAVEEREKAAAAAAEGGSPALTLALRWFHRSCNFLRSDAGGSCTDSYACGRFISPSCRVGDIGIPLATFGERCAMFESPYPTYPHPFAPRRSGFALALLAAVALIAGGLVHAAPAHAATTFNVLFDDTSAETAGNADWIISTAMPDPLAQNPAPTTETSGRARSRRGVSRCSAPA